MRPLILIIVIITALALLKIYVWDADEASALAGTSATSNRPAGSQTSLPVDIYIANTVETDNTIYASGTIVANEQVELQSEVSGRLIGLNISEGSFVQKGQLIAKLDDSELRAQLKRLDYEDELAIQVEARQRKLLDINAISKEEYDLAMNKVNTLGADRELLEVQLEKTEVRAPFSGRIGFKNISEGAYITPNVIIANLVQTNPVKIDFSIPEKYTNDVQVGQEAIFEVDGVNDQFLARVIAVDPQVDEDLRTLRLRARADNSLGLLRPGMFVRVELPLGSRKSIMVPTESVMPILKGKIVYLLKNGLATETKVTTGLRTDKTVQILEGMEVGDSVIVSALMSLKPDLKVQVQEVVNLEAAP
ncbi:MAG: efflux RND transporter periplasmic adaptor subunit [Saprospiraceae bacterium]|nr:efflux RND transporter periplasmic adaptor subunit [Saprospiraceae bacterium]